MSKSGLLKATAIIGSLTLLSRVLGMTRDIFSAKGFGTSWQWDAFIYAFMLPNFMRRLVGEGALTSAFIPIYTEILQKEGKDKANQFAHVMSSVLFLGLGALVVAVEIFLIFFLKSPHLSPTLRLTAELSQLFFPYLIFMAYCALAAGILNCHNSFFSPSLNPVILDLVWIFAVLWVLPMNVSAEQKIFLLSFWIFVSGAIQLGVQIPFLFRAGYNPHFVLDFSHPDLKRVGRLVLPAILGFAVMQINLLVDSTMGLWIGAGANSSLWYGNRLMQFPLGVFAIAMGTALLPAISHYTARNEHEEAKRSLAFALRSIFFIIIPATVGLIVLRIPIIRLLFERGEFDAVSTARTSFVVLCYTIGLFAYSGQKVVVTGFYSLKDTQTPMKLGAVCLFLNILLNFILMGPLREGGLALSTSISGMVNFFALIYLYDRKISGFPAKEIAKASSKILTASLFTGVAAHYFYSWIYPFTTGSLTLRLFLSIFSSIGVSILVYLAFCFLLKVTEVHDAFKWMRTAAVRRFAPKAVEDME